MKPNYVEVYGELIRLKEKLKEIEKSLNSLMSGMEEALSEPEEEHGQFTITIPSLSDSEQKELKNLLCGQNLKEQGKQLK